MYIRTNIERIETEEFIGWQYDEIQYTKNDYLELTGQKTETLEIESTATLEYAIEIDFRLASIEILTM